MRVLFFTYDFPFPTTSGGKTRAFNLLKYAGKNVELFLFSFTRESIDADRIEEVKKIGVKEQRLFQRKKLSDPSNVFALVNPKTSIFHSLYSDPRVSSELKDAIDEWKIDIVHFESFYTAFYLNKSYGVKQIFGTENIEYRLYEEYAKYIAPIFLKPFYFWEARKIKSEELGLYKAADASLAVLQDEAEYIKKISGKKSFVIPNGVDLSYFSYKQKKIHEKKKTILFIGNFSYFPNIDAVKFFYKNVFSCLALEELEFLIVGKNAAGLQFLKNDKRVKTFDYFEDIRDAYYKSDIFVSPIRIGGGTNFKILEAMACGVPVIAFPHRTQGIGAKDGKEILLAKDSNDFVKKIHKVFAEKDTAAALTRNARKLIEEKFSWDKIGATMNTVWHEVHNA